MIRISHARKLVCHLSKLISWLTAFGDVKVNVGLASGFMFRVGLGCVADISEKQT
jgi:hypothetical protein